MGPQRIRIDASTVRFNPQTGKPEVHLIVQHLDPQGEVAKEMPVWMIPGDSIEVTINPAPQNFKFHGFAQDSVRT